MKYQNILQLFLCYRVNGVNLNIEAVSSETLFKKNKHWICRINLVFIHRTNNSSWFCRDDNNNNNNNNNSTEAELKKSVTYKKTYVFLYFSTSLFIVLPLSPG